MWWIVLAIAVACVITLILMVNNTDEDNWEEF